jgi:hypothetical protein
MLYIDTIFFKKRSITDLFYFKDITQTTFGTQPDFPHSTTVLVCPGSRFTKKKDSSHYHERDVSRLRPKNKSHFPT